MNPASAVKCPHNFLGGGTFGRVWRGEAKDSDVMGTDVALKVILIKDRTTYDAMKREIDIMLHIKRNVANKRYLLPLYRVWYDKSSADSLAECTLVVPLLDKFDLMDVISGKNTLPAEYNITEVFIHKIITQLFEAVGALHDANICHFDIKMENIVMKKDEPQKICLIDLGLAEYKAEGWSTHSPVRSYSPDGFPEGGGTFAYCAPEFWGVYAPHSTPVRGPSCDIWAIGVVLYLLVNNAYPFGSPPSSGSVICNTNLEVYKRASKIKNDQFNLSAPKKNVLHFCDQLLMKSPKKRLTIQQALDYEWMKPSFEHRGTHLFGDQLYRASAQGRLISEVLSVGGKQKAVELVDIKNLAKRFAKIRRRTTKGPRPDLSDPLALANFNSSLSREEFTSLMEEIKCPAFATSRVFDNIDTDRSGSVDFQEFITALIGFLGGSATVDQPAFNVFDMNGDGIITYAEFSTVFANNLPDVNSDELFRLIAKIDGTADIDTAGINAGQFSEWYETGNGSKEIIKKVLVGPLFTDVVTLTMADGGGMDDASDLVMSFNA